MTKKRIFLVILVSIFVFLLVYTPHYNYSFPSHIDEWHHITEAIKLKIGEYRGGTFAYRIGFQFLLLLLSKITNLVLIYKFLPAIWATITALVLLYIVYKKTDRRFYTALFAMIFFASIKSNVNITGLWFFTPLSFSLPFIFLYVYFLTEGIEKQKKKLILASLAIMILLLFVHPISVLFVVPFLSIYSLFNFKYIKKERKFFSAFLLIPIIGALFYKFISRVSWSFLAGHLINDLQFKRGWGVLEINNSPFELYSLMGYILAVIGLILIFKGKKNFKPVRDYESEEKIQVPLEVNGSEKRCQTNKPLTGQKECISNGIKKYLAYGLWPIAVLIMIIIYKITGVSYLSPYQRNLYYFAISLPILSAFGLDYFLKLAKKITTGTNLVEGEKKNKEQEISGKAILIIIFIIIMFFTFRSYTRIPEQIDLYQLIDNDDYQALLFLSTLPKSTVMAVPSISNALYPISKHDPVATYFFYGNRKDVEKFFSAENCKTKKKILDKYKAKYVLSKFKINCGWNLIYKAGDYIYEVNPTSKKEAF